MKKRGIALVIALMVIMVLFVLSRAIFSRSMTEYQVNKRYAQSLQAFWVAEAGVNKAFFALSVHNNTNMSNVSYGDGRYTYTIVGNDTANYTINVTGTVGDITRTITTHVSRQEDPSRPTNFYDNALYAAGNFTIGNGNFLVTGNVTHAGNFTQSGNPGTINGTRTQDANITPLYELDFDYLRDLSIQQGNYHNSSTLTGPFPTSFWYNQSAGTPNVIYMEGDFALTGNTHVGGFIITRGEVIFNETVYNESEYNSSIAGTVNITGVIYTPGKFTMKGTADITGGVWSGQTAVISGNPILTYNSTYMQAINNLNADTRVNTTYWREGRNPYPLD